MYYTPPRFYPMICKIVCYKHVFTRGVENSVDPDQLASEKPADLDLHCFQNRKYPDLAE